jgi:hypothetical protein
MQLGVQILVDDPDKLEEIRKRCERFNLAVRVQLIVNLGNQKSHWSESVKFLVREQMLSLQQRVSMIFA